MTDSERLELLSTLDALCQRYPDWRFGQLVANVAGWTDIDVWDVEDQQWLDAANEHLQRVAERESQPTT